MADVAVDEHHVVSDAELARQAFERETIAFTLIPDQVGMRCTQHDVNHLGMAGDDFWQGLDGVFDSLARGQQPESQQDRAACHIEQVLVKIRIRKRQVGNAMRDERDFFIRHPIDRTEQPAAVLRHADQPRRAFDQVIEGCPLVGIRMFENRVQSGDGRHACAPQQADDMAARRAAVDAEFVLHA